MPTRLQVLIPISAAAVIVGVAGMLSLPSEVSIESNSNFLMGTVQLDDKLLQVYLADTEPRKMRGLMWESQDFLAVSADNAQYVLELTAGYVDKYEVTENSQLELISI